MGSRMTRPRSALAAVAITLTMLATACGGGDEVSPTADDPAAPATTGGSDTPKDAGGDFCTQLKDSSSQLGPLLEASVSSDPEVRLQAFTKQKDLNAKLLKAAPKEIRSDFETQTRTQDAMIDAQIQGDQVAAAALAAKPEFQAAVARLGTYYKDKCGIDLTRPGG